MKMEDLINYGVLLVVTTMVLGVGAQVLDSFQSGFTANSWAYNITSKGLESQYNLSLQLPIIGTTLGAFFLIGIIIAQFYKPSGNSL